MKKIIAVCNQKGGVGKTTTAINISACLAVKGKRTLLIDIDPQANSTSGVGIDKSKIVNTIYESLINDEPLRNCITDTEIPNLKICPSNIHLASAEIELVSAMSRETILKNAIKEIEDEYDYIIIDCPPSLGLITLNSLTAANSILVPIQCEFFALSGLTDLINTILLVKKNLNKNLDVEGVVLTMFDVRTNLSMQVVEDVKNYFKQKVYKTIIPRNVKLSEAPSHGQPIILYDPKSKGAECYNSLVDEIIKYTEGEG